MAPLARMFVVLRGLFYAAAFTLLWAWLASVVRRYDPALPQVIPRWLQPCGLVLSLAGALVALSCVATFVTAGRGTPAPFDPPREFVAVGPYRFVRNPMYLGVVGVLCGAGIALESTAILLLAVAFLLSAHLVVVLYEEPSLTARFGASYLRYKDSVNRWLPSIGREGRG
jgi:protein-S-isoprenylcysteine O-methyltransferase Ste14